MPVATKEYAKESLLQKQRVSSHEEGLMFSLLIKVVSGIFPFSKEHWGLQQTTDPAGKSVKHLHIFK